MLVVKEIDGPGAYLIRCKVNGRVYVGSSSVSCMNRRKHHTSRLKAGKHMSPLMQHDFNAFGEEQFEFEVIDCATGKCGADVEQELIERYDATNPDSGYNTCAIAYERIGRPKKAAKMKVNKITIAVTP